ncbi:MAG: 50S ribosomal protein L18 [Candidatus Moraniibacteriota bacterium]|nr:MAG: 50S ribosomal protein L18 [Candidatus Moranbacteria bacterium]
MYNKVEKRSRRHARVRAKISGTPECPRVAVHRSLQGVSVQAIDDLSGKTLAQANFQELGKKRKNTVVEAAAIGKLLGDRLAKLGVKRAVFDRAGYLYHGKVKAVAESVRESGITM